MKTVFSDISAIAHMWASQTQETARTSSINFYFDGLTIYSYGRHFPIAKHVHNSKGECAVLFTESSYSVTTAKHIRIVQQACNHKNIVYCASPDNSHDANFNQWAATAESIAKNLLKAKKPEKYLSEIGTISHKANVYASFFGLSIPENLTTILSIANKEQFAEYQSKKEEREQAQRIAAEKELAAKHKKELAKWLRNETNRLYYRNGFDFLRLNDNRIETTQAVQIPLDLGKRLFEQIKNKTLAVGAKVLDYEVLEVGKNIKIGCHNFKTDYLLKFGTKTFNN